MNIIEAIKSGLPFKRPNSTFYIYQEYDLSNFSFTREDYLANDWEIEIKETDINEESFNDAWNESLKSIAFQPENNLLLSALHKQLKKHLNLID